MQGEYKLSDEQSPLASSTVRRCLVSCFVQMRHLITFSLRGLAGRRIVGGGRLNRKAGHTEMVLIGGALQSRVAQRGADGIFGFHSRARCASAIWAGVICLASASRYSAAFPCPFAAATLYHLWAWIKSWTIPRPCSDIHPSFAKARASPCSAA